MGGRAFERVALGTHFVVLAVCAFFTLYAAFHSAYSLIDDALISLTYAKNIALGHGPVYNAGAPSAGFTSPVHTLLLAAACRVGGLDSLPVLLASMTSGAFLVLAAFAARLFHRELGLSPTTALCVGLLWLGIPFYYQGGESALFLVLLVVALVLWERGRSFAFGVAVGLLFLTRGEGALLGLLWGLERGMAWWRGGRGTGKDLLLPGAWALAGFLLPVLPWWIYAYKTFGAILPDTLTMKMAGGGVAGAMSFARALWQGEPLAWGMSLVGPWRALLWPLALHGAVVGLRESAAWRRYGAFCLAYTLGYVALGVANYPWYHVPNHFFWLGCIGISVGTGLAWLTRAGKWLPLRGVLAVALVLLVAGGSLRFAMFDAHAVRDPRERPYRRAAEWVTRHLHPRATVATREVGYLGYYTSNPIVDLDGLTSPELAPLVLANRRDEIIRERNCDVYVLAHEKASGPPPGLISIAGVVFQRVEVFESEASWPLVYGLYLNARTRALLPGVERPTPPAGAILVKIGADKI